MKFMVGKKSDMTQLYAEDGIVTPVTIVHAGPLTVTQVKTKEKDGYGAVQVGFGTRKAKRVSKPVKGHLKGKGPFAVLKEFRVGADEQYTDGQIVTVDTFVVGDVVDVVGTSIGRGFAGVVKRHGFRGAPASHGMKDQLRMPGSLASRRQGPVKKGQRMGGHMGAERVTVKNLTVMAVYPEKNEIALKGAVPGARGGMVTITSAKNASK